MELEGSELLRWAHRPPRPIQERGKVFKETEVKGGYSVAIQDWTPVPVQKRGKVVIESESEDKDSQLESNDRDSQFESDDNSQFESEDSCFITPKAIKGSVVPDDNESDTDSSAVEVICKGRAGSLQSEYESDYRGTGSDARKDKIDLTKVLKNATTKGKDKKAFRKEVEERRALVAKEQKEVR